VVFFFFQMDPAPDELRRVVSKTVWEMVDLCCHNLSGSALKLHDRGRLSNDGLRLSLAVVRRVRQLLPKPSLYWFQLPKPLPSFHSGVKIRNMNAVATNQPLELLIDWPELDVDSKAGPANENHFPSKLNATMVVENLAKAKTLQELLPALGECLEICKGIRDRCESAGIIAGSKLHVLGLLHSCFAANLGAQVPSPRESRGLGGTRSTSAWTSGPISAEMQEQAIWYLLELACELAAASKSLPRTRGTTALDTIATGYLVVVLDAIVMAKVNAAGKNDGPKPRELLWASDYAQLGLCVESMGADPSSGLSFANCTQGAPISWPGALVVRADVQSYLDAASKRGLSGSIGTKGQFLNFPPWKGHDEAETIFYLSNDVANLDPSCAMFRKLAISMGYHPAQNINTFNPKYHHDKAGGVTIHGDAVMPCGKGVKDWPDLLIRNKCIYKDCIEKEITFDSTPDKQCHMMSEHMFAIDWAFGSEMDSKLFAREEGKSLCRVRDMILLSKIMLEPRNTNARPVTGLKAGKLCKSDLFE
jgi:hypothetical protein